MALMFRGHSSSLGSGHCRAIFLYSKKNREYAIAHAKLFLQTNGVLFVCDIELADDMVNFGEVLVN